MKQTLTWDGGTVSAAWRETPGANTVVALTHGASGGMDNAGLKAFADLLAQHGVSTVRFNLPFAEAGRSSPGKPEPAQACIRAVVTHLSERFDKVFVGGRSYGGRMASHVAAEGARCAGLVLLGYPLHAPGKPDKLRDEHLSSIPVPMLFLQGDRDPFATPSLLEQVVARLPRATLHWVRGGDHSHKVSGRKPAEVVAEMVDATVSWMRA